MDTMGKYVNNTLDELEDGTLGVYNKTTDEASLCYSLQKSFIIILKYNIKKDFDN